MPLLASYAVQFGAGAAAVGAIVATYSLMHLVLAPVWGGLSDRLGRRPVLLIGLAGTLVSSLVFAAAQSVLVLLLSRVLAGGLGATLNVAQAYAADESSPGRRTGAMGLIGAAYGVGFVVGPAIGALMSRFGDAAPGLAAAGIATLNLMLAWRALGEPPRRRQAATRLPLRAILSRGQVPPFVAAFCSTLSFSTMYVVFPLFAELGLGFDRARVGMLFALIGFIAAAVQGSAVGPLVRRLGEGRLVWIGAIGMAAGLALLPASGNPAHSLTPLWVALALVGAGFGLTSPAEAGYVSRHSPADDQGRTMGLLQSVNAMSRIVGPLLAGGIMAAAGAGAAFWTAAGAAVVAGMAGAMMRSRPVEDDGG